MSDKFKVRLANGIEIEASFDQVVKLMKETADGIHYTSSSRGLIPIKGMATPHLKNAILKTLEKEIADLRKMDVEETVAQLNNGIGRKDITFLSMVKELNDRVEF